ncbi:MAG: (Fe-S)-binding protein [Bacteroidales bacterium]|nr:(Fe-S)-binding protein [Bacteroidales bacterium]
MLKQIIFIITLLVTIGVFAYSVSKIIALLKLTKKAYPIKDIWKRIIMTVKVAFFQSKIFRRPVIGFMHALVFWGFLVICIGSVEIVFDGVLGTERIFAKSGLLYDIITASGDIFGLLVLISVVVFLIRRVFMHVKRFHGIEMKKKFHTDANISLSIILLLMISLLSMNSSYIAYTPSYDITGTYPVSIFIAPYFHNMDFSVIYTINQISWWMHILLVFFFANYLPYSKHFHVFMSIPNVFVSRLESLGKLPIMENVTKEVKLMLNPQTAYSSPAETDAAPSRFGVKDVEDGTWKNFADSLSCTQCGRCTSVCPANITGKKLSPRKILIDFRARMKEKGKHLLKDKNYNDNKFLLRDFISEEEIWACTTCNACAKECPVNINHPTLIVDLRRYLVMEEAKAPSGLNAIFANIENNGAPWQFSPQDRLLWANELYIKNSLKFKV